MLAGGRLHLLLGALARLEILPGLRLALGLLVHLLEALLALEALLQLLLARLGLLIIRLFDHHPLRDNFKILSTAAQSSYTSSAQAEWTGSVIRSTCLVKSS